MSQCRHCLHLTYHHRLGFHGDNFLMTLMEYVTDAQLQSIGISLPIL